MLTLDEAGLTAGGHCWIERRLFELAGRLAVAEGAPELKLMADRHSQHHAWRAGQWWERLPVVADVERDALVAPPDPSWAALTAALDEAVAGPPALVAAWVGLYRVAVPRLASRYRRHGAAASPLADGAVLRTLGLVGPDLAADWGEGEAALQQALDAGGVHAEAAAAYGRFEALVAPAPTAASPAGQPED